MSVRSDARICRACGTVDLASNMRRQGGPYDYACAGCAGDS